MNKRTKWNGDKKNAWQKELNALECILNIYIHKIAFEFDKGNKNTTDTIRRFVLIAVHFCRFVSHFMFCAFVGIKIQD